MNIFAKSAKAAALSGALLCPAAALAEGDVQGYWAGGYVDGQGGEIQFEMTVIEGYGLLKYDTSNWGALGFAICEYIFALEGGQPGKLTRNSGAGTGDCLETPAFTISRPGQDGVTLVFANPEIALEAVELAGILRPFAPTEAHAPVAGLDVLGAAPGMSFEEIDAVLTEKGYARHEVSGAVLEYDGFTIEHKAWGRTPDESDTPTDWVYATFTAKKDWAAEETPVATNVGREWDIPESEGISGATMVDTLAKKYGARSNSINEDRMYDRAGQVMLDTLSCPDGAHQPINANYALRSESGEEQVYVTCGPIVKAYVGTDSSTGRAISLKLRVTDPDPIWADFWSTWSHTEGARIKSIHDGVTGATGAAPEL